VCCEKCQMNNSDMLSNGRNSIHEVVHNCFLPDGPDGSSMELGMRMLEIFEIYGGDRIDLLVPDHDGNTVIDEVIEQRNVDMLRIFVSMRKTDVVEKLITQGNVHRAVVGRLTSGFDSFVVMNSKPPGQEQKLDVEGGVVEGEKAVASAFEEAAAAAVAAADGPTDADAEDKDKEVTAVTISLEGFQLGESETNPAVVDDEFGESIIMVLEREFIEMAEKAGFHDYDSDPVAEEVPPEAADEGAGVVPLTGFGIASSQILRNVDPNAPPDAEAVVEEPPPKPVRVKGVMTPELETAQEFMSVILGALESVGCALVAEDAHAHACFHSGIMYTDYCNAQCE
jgi:hypothetical protein